MYVQVKNKSQIIYLNMISYNSERKTFYFYLIYLTYSITQTFKLNSWSKFICQRKENRMTNQKLTKRYFIDDIVSEIDM